MPLKCNHIVEDGVSKVYWHGSIDEDWDSDISNLSSQLKDNVEFHFTNIDTLNSIGIRLWTQFIDEICNSHQVKYFDCPSLIIRLLSISDKFLGQASLESFFVTFDCPECDAEIAIKFEVAQGIDAILEEASKQNCRSCGNKMEFQEDPEVYEDLLKSLKRS